jgi:hypothetical protein
MKQQIPNLFFGEKKQYGFNLLACQINYLTDNLKSYLPPTDTRLRPDLSFWEAGNIEKANKWKAIVEDNQRKRRKIVKEKFKDDSSIDLSDERTFYKP